MKIIFNPFFSKNLEIKWERGWFLSFNPSGLERLICIGFPICLIFLLTTACGESSVPTQTEKLVLPTVFVARDTEQIQPSATESPLFLKETPSLTPALTQIETTPEQTGPTPTQTPFVCENSLPIGVQINQHARVNYSTGLDTRLRRTPSFSDNVIALLPEGAQFLIIDGPQCAYHQKYDVNVVFWKIRVDGSGKEGWIVEGIENNYFIEPWP